MQKEHNRQTKVVAVADDCDETAAQKEPHKKVGRKGGGEDRFERPLCRFVAILVAVICMKSVAAVIASPRAIDPGTYHISLICVQNGVPSLPCIYPPLDLRLHICPTGRLTKAESQPHTNFRVIVPLLCMLFSEDLDVLGV